MEGKIFADLETDDERKSFVWDLLPEKIQEKYLSINDFFAAVPLTPVDMNFYLRDRGNDDTYKNYFAHLEELTASADDKRLLTKYQRAFIIAANNAYQDPKEESSYLNKLDLVAVDLNTIVTKINAGAFDDIPSLVKIMNTTIKNAHKDRPIDMRQNAFNIAATIGYLAIAISAIVMAHALSVVPLALYISMIVVAGLAGGGFGYMAAKSYNGIMRTEEKAPKQVLFVKWDDKDPHTIFTPRTKPLSNAQVISNIAKRKRRGHRISESLKSLKTFKPKYEAV